MGNVIAELAHARSFVGKTVGTLWGPCQVLRVEQSKTDDTWLVIMAEQDEIFSVDLLKFREMFI